MSARTKLNTAYVAGSVVTAGIIGLLTGSWTVFGIALAIMLALNFYDGSIRPRK